jgi:ABC transport system ATP-binding/permease protein
LRHLPGGVDEYLALRSGQDAAPLIAPLAGDAASASASTSKLGGAELRNAQKEIASTDRKIQKMRQRIVDTHELLATHDQGDYVGLGELSERLRAHESDLAALETRWLELSELLD